MRCTTCCMISYSTLASSAIISLKNLCDRLGLTDGLCCKVNEVFKFLSYAELAIVVDAYGVPFVVAQLHDNQLM